jgi:hypothetical protein
MATKYRQTRTFHSLFGLFIMTQNIGKIQNHLNRVIQQTIDHLFAFFLFFAFSYFFYYCCSSERFLGERGAELLKQQHQQLTYIPFGAGKRRCVGEQMAMQQALTIIASLFRNYKIGLVPGQTIDAVLSLTLHMANGLHCRVTPRME